MIFSSIGALLLMVVIGVVALRWFIDVKHDPTSAREPDIDYDELNQAEREVRDLDANVRPDEADEELTDWGPGAPR